ncbi:hypothetical protein GCM10027277_12640 [Pseudoduganella ginsengisoli]|uniref:DUF1571 domain-containing protein n=1 Tax=Pseudoduganella ginsengisoli TaxID=1462440 RepID=A0A6L6PVS2_9BURK|nr:hypothetical protein [Pseudoduganella ginsengisoli]MTW01653.1 hypothetical protein [Pseudoduganella ginsengisoli]
MLLRALLLTTLLANATMALAAETPQQIVTQMHEAYASLRSYSDTGVVLTHMPENETPDETVFRSVFVRPDLFRFEWTTHHPYPPLRHIKNNSVIWSNANGAFFWSDRSGRGEKLEQRPSLDLAVAGATGVSHGSAHTIASLLLPQMMGRTLDADIQWSGEAVLENFEGAACYHLTGQHARKGRYEMWIAKDDMLVRKIAIAMMGIPVEEIRRDIQVNVAIPERTFASEK